MFYLKYLFAEIFRRFGKTITIVAGLAIASTIIIMIISFSQALSDSQKVVLNPLQNVGTDAMLTRSVAESDLSNLDETTRNEYMKENRVTMDFSKLGNPGESFSSDQFMAGTLLTYDTNVLAKIDSSLVSDYATGLILNITHQEGTIPKVSSTFSTEDQTIDVSQEIPEMTDEERAAQDTARQQAQAEIQAQGLDPHSDAAREIERKYMDAAMPERFKKMTASVHVPGQTITQDVGPISTDVKTENYTISGVDTSKANIGLILPDQITEGGWFSADGQIILNKSYADKNSKKVGDSIIFNTQSFTVVGIVDPKLYTNTTDFYLPLEVLQNLYGQGSRINIVLAKAVSADKVDAASNSLKSLFTGATVVNSKDTASKVSGSLVQAASLTNKFIGITSIIVLVASFIIVSLLTISSINKRVREIGTLKAIGWSNFEVVRQIIAENIVLGLMGAVVGVGLGILAIYILNRYNISFDATVQSLNSSAVNLFRGPGRQSNPSTASTTEASIKLKIATDYLILALGAAVSLVGSLLSGFFAALKVSRLKPSVSLRNLE